MKTAEQIKKALKENGYNAREVTVKIEKIRYDHNIIVTIRKRGISAQDIAKIVKPFEIICRSDYHGILKGGNVFIDVIYAEDWIGETIQDKMEEAESLWKKSDPNDNNSFYIRNNVRLCNNGQFLFLTTDGNIGGKTLADVEDLAEWLAIYDYGKGGARYDDQRS